VRLVLGLRRALKLPVLAEGVETVAELAFPQNENRNEVQGYLIGRPGSIERFRPLTHGVEEAGELENVIALTPNVAAM
jgi:EAL domain-containing protein (putative c-di-GMP-specific phosphodiesterase class I)